MQQIQKEVRPAVAAIIFNSEGNILLQKRADVNQWCIISGHVEYGETIQEAILREVFEELNVTAELTRLIGIYSSSSHQVYDYIDKTIHYITSYFEVKLTHELDLTFKNSETKDLRFFKPDELPDQLATICPEWLSDALNTTASPFIR